MTQHNRPSGTQTPGDAPPQPAAREPGWVLAPAGQDLPREEVLARYRRQRALPDDPFAAFGKPPQPAARRATSIDEPKPAARFVPRAPEVPPPAAEAVPEAATASRKFSMAHTFAIAAAMALGSGAMVGAISAKLSPVQTVAVAAPEPEPASAPDAAAAAVPVPVEASLATPKTEPPPARSSEVRKKPVPTATLQVADAAGETNSYIPLALRAAPAGLDQDILLKISGVPEGAYLTSGRRDEDRNWALTPDQLDGLKLVVPEAQTRQIDLAVAAVEPGTGALAAPVKTMTVELSNVVVEPASAPPPGQRESLPAKAETGYPAAIPPPDSINVALQTSGSPAAQQLIAEGNSRLRYGSVKEARSAYEKAWNAGSAEGAFAMARSYDPVVLASLGIRKATPDKAQALAWYERAAAAGNTEAAGAIVRLQLKP